jgi:hypothetical protein
MLNWRVAGNISFYGIAVQLSLSLRALDCRTIVPIIVIVLPCLCWLASTKAYEDGSVIGFKTLFNFLRCLYNGSVFKIEIQWCTAHSL